MKRGPCTDIQRGKTPIAGCLPQDIQHHVVHLATAHPFTSRELAHIVEDWYAILSIIVESLASSTDITSPWMCWQPIATWHSRRSSQSYLLPSWA